MAAVEIERPGGETSESTSFRLLPSSRPPRIRAINPGEDLGTALRKARRRRRISLAQAARDTRIAPRYLNALERGAPMDAFPAPMYARAFLREYTRYLRIETEPLLQLLAPYEPPPVAPTLAVLSKVPPPGGIRGRVLMLAGAAVLSILLVVGSQDPLAPSKTAVDPADLAAAIPSLMAAPGGVTAAAEEDLPRGPVGQAPAGALVQTTGRSWLRVTVDGAVVFEGTAPAGWSRSFADAERIEMLVGNAAAVALTVDGKAVGRLGAAGEVRRIFIVAGPDGFEVRNLPRA
ncbi:MAG TPA: RodZ domain-containing protein [Actinomycetota bacterium]|nr:RodZ domain-containing protein [Actinomycetota bacterium]